MKVTRTTCSILTISCRPQQALASSCPLLALAHRELHQFRSTFHPLTRSSTAALAGAQPLENNKEMPGAFPATPAAESGPVPTLQDNVVGVNPLPATAGIGNPVQLAPGEKVPDPSTLTDNTVQSTARTDKAAYAAGGAAYAPTGKVDDSAARFGRPAAGGAVIPESSIPMGNSGTDVTNPMLSFQSSRTYSSRNLIE